MQFLNTPNICQWNLNDLSADPPNSLSHSRNLISYPNGSQWFPSFYCIFRIHPGKCSQPPMTPVFFFGWFASPWKGSDFVIHARAGGSWDAGMPGLDTIPSGTPNSQPNINRFAMENCQWRAVQPQLVLRIFPARHGQDFSLFDSSHWACHQESSSWHWRVDHCTLQSLGYESGYVGTWDGVAPVNDIQSGWSYIMRGLIGFACFWQFGPIECTGRKLLKLITK